MVAHGTQCSGLGDKAVIGTKLEVICHLSMNLEVLSKGGDSQEIHGENCPVLRTAKTPPLISKAQL